ncbi:MAG TPA: hypothetical protein VGL56_16615 [Fimbriimonadaceae bacterium]|jgi:hypothetical protein
MNTLEAIPDMKTFLISLTKRMGDSLIRDLSFIPDDKVNTSPMGCARPALEFITECGGMNLYAGKIIAGEDFQPKSYEERQAFYATMDTRGKAVEFFNRGMEVLQTALTNATDEQLARDVKAPWGEDKKAYELAVIAVIHMAYHDGQVNYIQCLFGDGTNHWAD